MTLLKVRLKDPKNAYLPLLHKLPDNLDHLRVLYVINSYNLKQFHSLLVVLNAASHICEFGWKVKVVIQTTVVIC